MAMAATVALSLFPLTALSTGTHPDQAGLEDLPADRGANLDSTVLDTPSGYKFIWGRFDGNAWPTMYYEGPSQYSNNGPVEIILDLWEIDSWDYEPVYVNVEGTWILLGRYKFTSEEADVYREKNGIRVYRVGQTQNRNLAANPDYEDQKHEFRIVVPQDRISGDLSLGFKSYTDQPKYDESYGFTQTAYVMDALDDGAVDGASSALASAKLSPFQVDDLASLTNDQSGSLNRIEGAFDGAWQEIGDKSLKEAELYDLRQLATKFDEVFTNWNNDFHAYEEQLWESMANQVTPTDGNLVMELTGALGGATGLLGITDPVSAVSSMFNAASTTTLAVEAFQNGEADFEGQPIDYNVPGPYAKEMTSEVAAELHYRGTTYTDVDGNQVDANGFESITTAGLDSLADFMANVKLAQEVYRRTDELRGDAVTQLSYIRDLGFSAELDWDYPTYVYECKGAPGCYGSDDGSIWIRAGSIVDPGNLSAVELRVKDGLEDWAYIEDIRIHW